MLKMPRFRSRVAGTRERPGHAPALVGCVCVCALFAVGCGQDLPTAPDRASPSGAAPAPAPSPSPVPTPIPTRQHTATPVPFNLTESRTFDVLGWDSWPRAPIPSAIQFRWNAGIGKYEVLAPGSADWNRLEAVVDRFGGPPHDYDVLGSDGKRLPFDMLVFAPPHHYPASFRYVGNARIWEGSFATAYFAFGIATAPADVPRNGTMTCGFGEDEIGSGALTFDLAAGRVSGWVEPFWGGGVRYGLVQTSFASGATTFAATFGMGGVLEGRFFGPGAVNVAVRAAGGGPGFSAVTGIMTGTCEHQGGD
jgi:hypothetical protein